MRKKLFIGNHHPAGKEQAPLQCAITLTVTLTVLIAANVIASICCFGRWPCLYRIVNKSWSAQISALCRLDLAIETQSTNNTTHVVGIAGNYPGKGNGASGFLTGLTSEENLPQTIPYERWNLEQYYVPEARGDLSMYVRMASFVNKLEHFDAALFRLTHSHFT